VDHHTKGMLLSLGQTICEVDSLDLAGRQNAVQLALIGILTLQ